MLERQPVDNGIGGDGNEDSNSLLEQPTRTFTSETEFQFAVEELAKEFNWDVFHVPDRAYESGIPYSGFPDLILRYRDESGCTIIIAELKYVDEARNDEERRRLEIQRQFLQDFAKYDIPVFLFYPRHWQYIYQVLKDGPPQATGDIIEPSVPIVRNGTLLAPYWDDDRLVHSLLQETAEFHHSGRGELAELRRMDPDKPFPATFWRLMAGKDRLGCPETEAKWGLILHGIALMTPNAHRAIPVGQALFNGGDNSRKQAFYSDLRFKRLLNARGTMLRSLLKEMFQMMNSSRQAFDWYEMASFILNDEEDSRQKALSGMAHAYYTTEYARNR